MVSDRTNAQSQKHGSRTKTRGPSVSPFDWIDQFDVGSAPTQYKQPVTSTVVTSSEDGSFAELFEKSVSERDVREGEVVMGTVLTIGPENVTVDVGFKCEGLVSVEEFKAADGSVSIQVGEQIPVLVESIDSSSGFLRLSKDRAEIVKAWDEIARACDAGAVVEGTVIGKMKGGLLVDIGVKAFLPISQIDYKLVKNLDPFLGQRYKFKIVKFNKKRGNIVLSRKAVIQQEKERLKTETLASLQEGQIVVGIVKNITDYGAFVDIGGMDGLLHITDMSWGRIKHPSEIFKVGDEITVKVLKYDREKERISLGLKQVTGNPWDELADKISVGDRVKGRVVSVKDYGAFVELADGIEGLVHVSEMSWKRDIKHPSKVLNPGDEIECMVLEIDTRNKRLSLGLKQLQENPWIALAEKYPPGTRISGEVKSITDFGVFVDIGEGIDGLIHISDVSWTKKIQHPSERFNKGDKVEAVVLSVDKDNEKLSLGMKQLEKDPWDTARGKYKVGASVEGKVSKVADFGAFVELEEGLEGLVYVSELADHRVEKPSDVVKVGDVIRAEVMNLDPRERRISLSIRKLKYTEERQQYESYAHSKKDKTSLGDLFGDQLKGLLKKSDEDGDGSSSST